MTENIDKLMVRYAKQKLHHLKRAADCDVEIQKLEKLRNNPVKK